MADDDYLLDGTYMLRKDFQIRAIANLITQHETYNDDMNRVDNEIRNTTSNFSFQGWFKVSRNMNIAINANIRAFKTAGYSSSALDVFTLVSDSTSKTVFRSLNPVFKILLYDRKFKLSWQSTFIIPVSKAFDLTYNLNTFRDPNQAQWINQLFYSKNYSEYFSLNMELTAIMRLGQTDGTRGFTLRFPVTPVFNYYFNSHLRLKALIELNPVIYEDFFATFYLREGAGITFYANETFSFDLLFTYMALGKRVPAQSSTVLGTKISF